MLQVHLKAFPFQPQSFNLRGIRKYSLQTNIFVVLIIFRWLEIYSS